MAGNTPPAGGTPSEWLTRGSGSQELVNSINKWADHYGIPRQFVYDVVWRENGIGAGTGNERLRITTSGAGAAGPMQLVPAVRNYYGINTNSSLDDQVFAGVSLLFENGTNTGYGRLSNVNGGQPFAQWDPAAAVGMYIGGPSYYRWLNGETGTIFGPTSQSYVIETTRNTVPLDQLPERFRNLPITRFYGEPHGSGDFGISPSFDPAGVGGDRALLERQLAGGPGGTLGEVPLWDQPGIINPEVGHYFQTLGLMPANLMPSGGTDFTNTTWDAPAGSQPGWWGPWGAEAVHNWAQEGISHGYDQPIMSLLGNLNYNYVDPGLAPGPGNAPLGGQPAPIGPTTGLPNVATGGVDLAHWVAQQWGTGWGTPGQDQLRSQIWPQWDPNISSGPATNTGGYLWDASPWRDQWDPNISSGPSNNIGGTIWDASPEPSSPGAIQVWGGDVSNWVPAGGTWGTPGQIDPYTGWQQQQTMLFNPNTQNWGTASTPAIGTWNPTGGYQGPSGFGAMAPGGAPVDYQHYFDTLNIPGGGAVQPGGGGSTSSMLDSGSYHSALFPGMYYNSIPSAGLGNAIDANMAANAAFNQQQVAAFNAQQAAHNQNMINNALTSNISGGNPVSPSGIYMG